MSTSANILKLGKLLAAHREISISTLGRILMGHGHFFVRVGEGRITLNTAERAIGKLSNHWPADLAWPSDIPRPEPSPGSPASQEAA